GRPERPWGFGAVPGLPYWSGADAGGRRIVQRLERCDGREAVGRQLQLPASGLDERGVPAARVAHVAHPHRPAERVAVPGPGDATDQHAVAPDGLVAQEQRLGIGEVEHHQPAAERRLALAQQRIAAHEAILLEGDGEAEAGLERRVLAADVVAPGAVALLHP